MAEIAQDENYQSDGRGNTVLVKQTQRVVSDTEIRRRDAPARIRQVLSTLDAWAADEQKIFTDWPSLTNAQKDAANRQMHDRFGKFLDRFGDVLLTLALDS